MLPKSFSYYLTYKDKYKIGWNLSSKNTTKNPKKNSLILFRRFSIGIQTFDRYLNKPSAISMPKRPPKESLKDSNKLDQ